MNRQQRRNRKPLSRTEWSLMLVNMQKTSPGLPEHLEIAQLLVGVIVDEQLDISEKSLAMLCGLACGHMAQAMKNLPPAMFVNKDGQPVYSAEQVAGFTGQSAEDAEAGIKAYAKEIGAETLGHADVFPLH